MLKNIYSDIIDDDNDKVSAIVICDATEHVVIKLLQVFFENLFNEIIQQLNSNRVQELSLNGVKIPIPAVKLLSTGALYVVCVRACVGGGGGML